MTSRELSTITPVILGLLQLGPRSGYDIKTFVDRSVRFFWAASYGQIADLERRLADDVQEGDTNDVPSTR